MTVDTDLENHWKAVELANDAESWLHQNCSITAMNHTDESITFHDFGPEVDCVWYTQVIVGEGVKFGHIVMRPGCIRSAFAAVSDFWMSDGLHWVLCGISNHPTTPDEKLAVHVQTNNLVHEATHCVDFIRSGHQPKSFKSEDLTNLARSYYNKPHELNAYFHEGLYSFLRNIECIKLDMMRSDQSRKDYKRKYLIQILYNGSYWDFDFMRSLTYRNRRRFLKRAFCLFAVLIPGL